jgi:hypothetical protein
VLRIAIDVGEGEDGETPRVHQLLTRAPGANSTGRRLTPEMKLEESHSGCWAMRSPFSRVRISRSIAFDL